MFESIPDYRKIVFLMLLIKNNMDLVIEYGFLKSDENLLSLDFQKTLREKIEDYFDFIKCKEESIIAKILSQ